MRALDLALLLLLATACGADRHEASSVPPAPAASSAGPSALLEAVSPLSRHDCEECSGKLTPALQEELTHRAQGTKPCYDRALARRRDIQGELMIRIRVGRSGNICTEKIVADEIGDDAFATCAATAFQGDPLPTPEGGCIEVNVPLAFVPGDGGVSSAPASGAP